MFGLGKTKDGRRTRHRVERGQGRRAEAGGQGLSSVRRSPSSPCRPTASSTAPSSTAPRWPTPSAPVREQGLQDQGRRRVAVGQRGDRQEDQPAGDDRRGARANRSTGRRSSTSRSTSRTSISTTRFSTPARAPTAKGTMDVLLVAAKKEKIADYTGVIAQAGRMPVVVDVDAFALQNAYEVNYGVEPGRRGPAERRRQRHQHQHRAAASSRSSPATSRWAATPTPRRSRKS